MIHVGAVEGGIFDEDVVFLFSNSYFSLKECVENKKKKGHKSLRVDIRNCEDCDVNYTTFKQVRDMVIEVSTETGVGLKIEDWNRN